jgi:hypothetical protein
MQNRLTDEIHHDQEYRELNLEPRKELLRQKAVDGDLPALSGDCRSNLQQMLEQLHPERP